MSTPSLPTPSRRFAMLPSTRFQRAGSLSVTWNRARLRACGCDCGRTAAGRSAASAAAVPAMARERREIVCMRAPGGSGSGDGTSERQADVVFGERRRRRARMDEVVELGALHLLAERAGLGELVHQRREPPREALGAPDAAQA